MTNAAWTPESRTLVERYVASRVGQVPVAVAALLAEYDRLVAWKAARIENHPTDTEFYGR